MFEKHQCQLQLHDGKEVAGVKVCREVHSRQRAEDPRQERTWLVQESETETALAGRVAEDGDVDEGRIQSCRLW